MHDNKNTAHDRKIEDYFTLKHENCIRGLVALGTIPNPSEKCLNFTITPRNLAQQITD